MFPFFKTAVKNLFTKPSTVMFPAVKVEAKDGYRGRITYDPEKCVNCGSCRKVCSPGAITVKKESVDNGTKITYEFDMTSCTFCGTCQDFCDEGAITLTTDFHIFALKHDDLIVRGSRIESNNKHLVNDTEQCILCGLCARNCPKTAITVDRASKSWTVDDSLCVKCGICTKKCPKKCLNLVSE